MARRRDSVASPVTPLPNSQAAAGSGTGVTKEKVPMGWPISEVVKKAEATSGLHFNVPDKESEKGLFEAVTLVRSQPGIENP